MRFQGHSKAGKHDGGKKMMAIQTTKGVTAAKHTP
jgi:hypothetical protein